MAQTQSGKWCSELRKITNMIKISVDRHKANWSWGERVLPIMPVVVALVRFGGFLGLFPLQHYGPSEGLQWQCNASKDRDHNNVCASPLGVGKQYVETLEHIEDAKNKNWISDSIMVDIPVDAIFMVLLGPQKQCKNLHKRQTRRKIQFKRDTLHTWGLIWNDNISRNTYINHKSRLVQDSFLIKLCIP